MLWGRKIILAAVLLCVGGSLSAALGYGLYLRSDRFRQASPVARVVRLGFHQLLVDLPRRGEVLRGQTLLGGLQQEGARLARYLLIQVHLAQAHQRLRAIRVEAQDLLVHRDRLGQEAAVLELLPDLEVVADGFAGPSAAREQVANPVQRDQVTTRARGELFHQLQRGRHLTLLEQSLRCLELLLSVLPHRPPGRDPPARRTLPYSSLFDPGLLAAQVAQVEQLGPAYLAQPHDVDLLDVGRMEREDAFHTDAAGGLAHREGGAQPVTAPAGDDVALEDLRASLVAFDDLDPYTHTVAGPELRDIFPDPGALDTLDHSHLQPLPRPAGALAAPSVEEVRSLGSRRFTGLLRAPARNRSVIP